MSSPSPISPRVVVLDFAKDKNPLKQFLHGVEPVTYCVTPDEFHQKLADADKPELAIVSLTDPQSRWLLRTLQVNRFQILMQQLRKPADRGSCEPLSAFVALVEFCASKDGSGVVVADIPEDKDLDVHQVELGPLREMLGPIRLAFVARDGFGLVPFPLLESPRKFSLIGGQTKPDTVQPPPMPRKWTGLDFDIDKELKNQLGQEFPHTEVRSVFLKLCKSVFPAKKNALLHTLHALRLCRRMVNWTLEGSPFRCTVFLGDKTAYGDKTGGTKNEIALIFAPEPPIPFDFAHLSDVRDVAEMIQSEGLLLSIDPDDCKIWNISAHDSNAEAGEHYWLDRYAPLTENGNCLVVHMRGGHFVELYGENNLALWYDGFVWRESPYLDLKKVCTTHFASTDGLSPRARRLMQVIPALLDAQKSSIILLLNSGDDATFSELKKKDLEPLRPKIAGWNLKSTIDRLPLSALEGILKLDGSHVIDQQGKLRYVALKIGDTLAKPNDPSNATADNEGTGTRAAKALSKALPLSFVVKVSASGIIKIYQDGVSFGAKKAKEMARA